MTTDDTFTISSIPFKCNGCTETKVLWRRWSPGISSDRDLFCSACLEKKDVAVDKTPLISWLQSPDCWVPAIPFYGVAGKNKNQHLPIYKSYPNIEKKDVPEHLYRPEIVSNPGGPGGPNGKNKAQSSAGTVEKK
jgi:hypothetical protein